MNEEPKMPRRNINDHLANERTFLAWVRTSIAVMGFGFVVVKFSVFMQRISLLLSDHTVAVRGGHSTTMGIVLVALGAAITGGAFVSFLQTNKQIENDFYRPATRHVLVLCIAILTIGAALIWYLIDSVHAH
ncbi:YidH family protein [Sphingobacterium griseoflavum]|uniref:Membrane protein n=1 Tax=Sphingobacterium griseoflavum TaxID=1474952 RepID=A0ABQ3HWS0_9SPHI|nr:DUF202 domain-containing protein [Sphingobacterium griseoflavum]GHE32051.1 membrane protein [Sphingobacterium griseoflavum]